MVSISKFNWPHFLMLTSICWFYTFYGSCTLCKSTLKERVSERMFMSVSASLKQRGDNYCPLSMFFNRINKLFKCYLVFLKISIGMQ